MAYVIPDNLRTRQDIAPVLRRVATALKLGLDDDAIVWFEPQWDESGEKPHFVIFLPDHGIAVAEVLSVRAAKLLGVLRGRLRVERDGEEIDVEQPLARAETTRGDPARPNTPFASIARSGPRRDSNRHLRIFGTRVCR